MLVLGAMAEVEEGHPESSDYTLPTDFRSTLQRTHPATEGLNLSVIAHDFIDDAPK